MTEPAASSAKDRRANLGVYVRLALLAGVLAGVYLGGDAVQHAVRDHLGPVEDPWSDPRILAATAAFMVLLALPYVPGMEVSVALLIALGATGALLVYVATLAALSLSYAAGRLIPTAALAGFLGWLRLERARALVQRLHPLSPGEKLEVLTRSAPMRWMPYLLRHRYLALALVLNLPGNSILGGGGGIALLAGLSGVFRYPAYLLTIALAAAPIPLAVWLYGGAGFLLSK